MNDENNNCWAAIDVMGKILQGKLSLTWEEFNKAGYFILMPAFWEPINLKVFRASFINDNDELINQKFRYSYPPKKYCNKPGRCHLAGFPVFYCASEFLGAIQETIITSKSKTILEKYNNIIYVGEWGLSTKKKYMALDIRRQYPIKDTSKNEFCIGAYIYFLNQLFSSERGYDISSGLSFMLMHGVKKDDKIYQIFEGGCDAIIYSSVAKRGLFTNYVFNPSIIDNHELELRRVFKLKIPVINWYDAIRNTTTLPMEIISVGKPISKEGNLLLWAKPETSDMIFIDSFSKKI